MQTIKKIFLILTLFSLVSCSLNKYDVDGPMIVNGDVFGLEDYKVEECSLKGNRYVYVISQKTETIQKTVSITLYSYDSKEAAVQNMLDLLEKTAEFKRKSNCVNCIYLPHKMTESEIRSYFPLDNMDLWQCEEVYNLFDTLYIRQNNKLVRLFSDPSTIFTQPAEETIKAVHQILNYEFEKE